MESKRSPQGESEARLSRIVVISVLFLVALLALYLVWGIGIPPEGGEAAADNVGGRASRARPAWRR